MDLALLKELSQADAIAAHEDSVRAIIKRELADYADTFEFDGLGSLLVTKASADSTAPTVMFAAHMDEVGFMIRSISDQGFGYLMPIGSVEQRSMAMQMVRVTTSTGEQIEGLLNVSKDATGSIEQMYVDFGFDTQSAALNAGISIGDMVTFVSDARELVAEDVVAGKALDDRVGCYTLIKVMQTLLQADLPINVVAAFTSSEEVGTRGGRLVANIVQPDLFFAIDVAKHPELDQGFMNHRRLGAGPMLEYFDKTMVPNPRLLRFIEQVAATHALPYQKDLMKGGGTDAGTAHLEHAGRLAAVLGIPLRYCHDSFSFANTQDLATMIALIRALIHSLDADKIKELYTY
ncbi:MAG: aminopeptidase [Lactobacillaceae bacterium]|jgi:putative aminopeptidase FrvX|nr:aminopeptidase [Lactobacillaceae bacterium]